MSTLLVSSARRKQILSSVKDLSPLPDLIHQAAKRVRRSAADRSREKVQSQNAQQNTQNVAIDIN